MKFIKVIVTIAIGMVLSFVLVGCSDINYNSGNSYTSVPETVPQMQEVLLNNNTSVEEVSIYFPHGGVLVLSNETELPIVVSLRPESHQFFYSVNSGHNAFNSTDNDPKNRILYIPSGKNQKVVFDDYTEMKVLIKVISMPVEVSENLIITGFFDKEMPDLNQSTNDLYQIFFPDKASEIVFYGPDTVVTVSTSSGEYIVRERDRDLYRGFHDINSETFFFSQEYVDKGYTLIVQPIGQRMPFDSNYTLTVTDVDEESYF